jgi:hypothetical protein
VPAADAGRVVARSLEAEAAAVAGKFPERLT